MEPVDTKSLEMVLCDYVTLPRTSTYRIRARLRLHSSPTVFLGENTLRKARVASIESNPTRVTLAASSTPRNQDDDDFPVIEKSSNLRQCSPEQQVILNVAREAAIDAAKSASEAAEA